MKYLIDKYPLKKAFTFLEIIIVLVIMTLLYNIATTSFSKNTFADKSAHFDLKAFLQNSLNIYNKRIDLFILDDEAIVRVGNDPSTDVKFNLPKDIEFYTYEQNGDEKDYFGTYYEDDYFKDVKFRYTIYKNGSSTKCIVFKDDLYHIESNYFNDKSTFKDIYDATEYLRNLSLKNGATLADE